MSIFKKVPQTPAENKAAQERGRKALSKRNQADERMYDRLYAKQAGKKR